MIIRVKEKVFNVGVTNEENIYIVKLSNLGQQGLSAYQIAVLNGFEGTEQEWLDSLQATGVETFLELTDTPSTYTGQAGKFPKVNEDEDGLEFAPAPDLQQVTEQGNETNVGIQITEGGEISFLDNDGNQVQFNAQFLSFLYGNLDSILLQNGELTFFNENMPNTGVKFGLLYPTISPTTYAYGINQGWAGGVGSRELNFIMKDPGVPGIKNLFTPAITQDETIATREWVQANAEPALGFTPEDVANKTTDINDVAGTYPDTPTVKGYVDLDENLWNTKGRYLGVFRIALTATSSTISGNAANTNNRVILLPLKVGKSATIDRIAIMNNAENNGVDSTVTFYLYDDTNGGLPGNKLFQVISSSGALIGAQKVIELTVNWALTRGNYYIGYHIRGLNTAGTNPTFLGGNMTLNSVRLSSLTYDNNQNSVFAVNNKSDDLGNNPTVINSNSTSINFPQIFIRLAQ